MQNEAKLKDLPRVGYRNKRAWNLLKRARPFVLCHQRVEYYVDRGGWAKPLEGPKMPAVHASKLLDPDKKGH